MRRTAFFLILLAFVLPAASPVFSEWSGVDETVVERYAEEHGRPARKPFFNTDRGDLLLFVFLLAGASGGFAAGYYWRKLTEKKPGNRGRAGYNG